ncbi:hypothetical protein OAC89_07190, partial [Deltaproteobacteria bacterium]|nr:hypothetical protein [Deltaproteobacteria bacterium]
LLSISFVSIAEEVTIREFDLKTIESLGEKIYKQDLLAARATDILFAQNLNLNEYPVRGWLVEQNNKKDEVIFIGEYDKEYRGVFRISFKNSVAGKFSKLDQEKLTEEQLCQFRARTLALKNIDQPCSQKYNVVILKDIDGDGYLVYALASIADPDVIVVGGHYRFTISEDGKTIEQKDKLFKSCLILDKTPPELKKGDELAAYTMSHVVSNTPVEIHVFLQMQNKPFYLITPDERMWFIEKGLIYSLKNGQVSRSW